MKDEKREVLMQKENEEEDTDHCLQKDEMIRLLVWTFLLGKKKGPGLSLAEVWASEGPEMGTTVKVSLN